MLLDHSCSIPGAEPLKVKILWKVVVKYKRLATALQLKHNTEFDATFCKYCSLIKKDPFAWDILLKLGLVGPSSILWELS